MKYSCPFQFCPKVEGISGVDPGLTGHDKKLFWGILFVLIRRFAQHFSEARIGLALALGARMGQREKED